MRYRRNLCTFMTTSCLFAFLNPASAQVKMSNFSGEWESVVYADNSGVPYSTLVIKLEEPKDRIIVGSYCYITQHGNRIDCGENGENNIKGQLSENGRKVNINFYSFFGAKNGLATLTRSGDRLVWKVRREPNGGFFYGPYSEKLKRLKFDSHRGEARVVVNKAYLYTDPTEPKVGAYVIKGDYVRLITISADRKFWKIAYPAKGETALNHWIDCRAIDFCP
jgi:hypothetical protein